MMGDNLRVLEWEPEGTTRDLAGVHVLPETPTDNEGTRASAAAPPFCPPPASGGAIALPLLDKALGSRAALPASTSPQAKTQKREGRNAQGALTH